jgi:tetratricopeptide (TPR) repeat protein
LGESLLRSGKLLEAKIKLEFVFDIYQNNCGKYYLETVYPLNLLAKLSMKKREFKLAEEYYKKSLDILEKNQRKNHI